MSEKVKSKRSSKSNEYDGHSLKTWIILTIVYIGVLMWLYGMTRIYFPDPIHVGAGQYFDIGIGVLFLGVAIYGVILGFLLRKVKNRNKKRR